MLSYDLLPEVLPLKIADSEVFVNGDKNGEKVKNPLQSGGECDIINHGHAENGVLWLHGQAVKTSPFHGGNTGSIPVGVIWRSSQVVRHGSATP